MHSSTRRPLTSRLRPAAALAAALAISVMLAPASVSAQKKTKPTSLNVIPITITSVNVVNGALVAAGTVGSHPFTAPLALTADPLAPGAACPVLHLSINPIHLDLLGLIVDTSAICLDITAHQGALLGDLLCSIGKLLDTGLPLADILGSLTSTQLDTLNSGLTSLLNQAVFIPLTSSNAVAAATCSVLSLSLGPVDLNLLGLEVHLDNCANGAVTLDITADPSGGLLGSLLCDLSHLLSNPNTSPSAILGKLRDVIAAIGQLIG